jgi:hypothetical protein
MHEWWTFFSIRSCYCACCVGQLNNVMDCSCTYILGAGFLNIVVLAGSARLNAIAQSPVSTCGMRRGTHGALALLRHMWHDTRHMPPCASQFDAHGGAWGHIVLVKVLTDAGRWTREARSWPPSRGTLSTARQRTRDDRLRWRTRGARSRPPSCSH